MQSSTLQTNSHSQRGADPGSAQLEAVVERVLDVSRKDCLGRGAGWVVGLCTVVMATQGAALGYCSQQRLSEEQTPTELRINPREAVSQ